jgi:hypothetical protein
LLTGMYYGLGTQERRIQRRPVTLLPPTTYGHIILFYE